MIRQYNTQRFRYREMGGKVRHVGTIECGEIFYYNGRKCQVTAFETREYCAARMVNGKWVNTRMAGGHIVQCRRLKDGKPFRLADHIVRYAIDGE